MPKNTRSNHHKKCAVHAGKKASVNGLKQKDILRRTKSSAAVKKGHRARCISKKKHRLGKNQIKQHTSWIKATQIAKKQLGLTGFVAIKKGTKLYTLAKSIHDRRRRRSPGAPSAPVAWRTRARTRKII